MRYHAWMAVVGSLYIAGCCNCLKPPVADTRPLPAPVSLDEQLQALNARASELPRLIATAEDGGVEVWHVEQGKQHHDAGDGKLFLQQNYADHTANVFMRATALGQLVFSIGRNEQVQWLVGSGDKPEAFVWPVRGPVNLWENADPEKVAEGGGGGALLQAGLIPEVLAITEIYPEPGGAGAGGGGGAIAMRVDDLRGVNDLLIQHRLSDGSMAVEREIIIDRRSGEVREVDLFGPGGVLLVHATLDNYAPVKLASGMSAPDGMVPTMPRRIVIDQPTSHVRIGLTLAAWEMPAKMSPAVFATPDWTEEGITPTLVR